MATVFLVSKPLAPPWNDGSKNLARDVAEHMERHVPWVVTHAGAPWRPRRGRIGLSHEADPGFQPAWRTQLRLVRELALGPRVGIWHFFFAPNPRTSAVARWLRRTRRIPTVHSVCSRPRRLEHARRTLFADRTVVLSRATEVALENLGVRTSRIPPCVPALTPPTNDERVLAREAFGLPRDEPLVVFPGDLEHGEGALRVLEAHHALDQGVLAMACRAKTSRARDAETRLRREFPSPRVRWIGETSRIHDLLGAADVVALPSSDLYAKVDLPLVLLEAMALGRAVVVMDDAPCRELADEGAAVRVEPRPDALVASLDELLGDDGARAAIGARAIAAASSRYAPKQMAAAYEALYDELLDAKAS